MHDAAKGGHLDIVQYMISKGANNLNNALVGAAMGGQIDLINFLIEQGADNLDSALRWAAAAGKIKAVKIFNRKRRNRFPTSAERSC